MKSIVNEASRKLTELRDFTPWGVSLAFEAILGRGRLLDTGRLLEGGASNTNFTPQGGCLLDTRRLFEWAFIRSFTVNEFFL